MKLYWHLLIKLFNIFINISKIENIKEFLSFQIRFNKMKFVTLRQLQINKIQELCEF